VPASGAPLLTGLVQAPSCSAQTVPAADGGGDKTPADTNGQNGSKDNGTGVPGLLKDSTRKSGRKRR